MNEAKAIKRLLAIATPLLFLALPLTSSACSVVACIDSGVELREDFAVQITHQGIPIPGVTVQVTTNTEHNTTTVFSGLTASDGTVHISSLAPGNYWLRADLLGIVAGSECFHVSARPSKKAKKVVKYVWGMSAPASRQIAGMLIDAQPSPGDTPLSRFLRVDVPVSGANLKLQNALTGAVSTTVTDGNGAFSFGFLPNGTYVLHAEGGSAGAREYDKADLLVRLSDTAASDTVVLKRRDAGGGDCGGTSLELRRGPIK
jgi:hypothetical protein